MSTALAPVIEYDQKRLGLIRDMLTRDINDTEFRLFVEIARHAGLDPLLKQIYAIKRGGKMTVQTGIDGYRSIASRTRLYAGSDDAVFDTEDGRHPNKATVTVYRLVRGQRCAFTASARWSEYDAGTQQWGKMPYTMLAKCAEALALRKAFPTELAGMYTDEEMQQADRENYPQPTTFVDTVKEDWKPREDPDAPDDYFNALSDADLTRMSRAIAKDLRISNVDYGKAFYAEVNHGKPIKPEDITRAQRLQWYLHLLDLQQQRDTRLVEEGVTDYQAFPADEADQPDLATLDPQDVKVS